MVWNSDISGSVESDRKYCQRDRHGAGRGGSQREARHIWWNQAAGGRWLPPGAEWGGEDHNVRGRFGGGEVGKKAHLHQ